MKHVTIELSEREEALISQRLSEGEFASLDDYVRAVVAAELRERAQERLEEQLLEGVRSERRPWTPERLQEIRRNAGLID
jgi:Arc/MetJ-type ribon-helix-helix transcriptional regulator